MVKSANRGTQNGIQTAPRLGETSRYDSARCCCLILDRPEGTGDDEHVRHAERRPMRQEMPFTVVSGHDVTALVPFLTDATPGNRISSLGLHRVLSRPRVANPPRRAISRR